MRFLFTTFEGGGHVTPALSMASRLRSRGHDVLFVSDEANRTEANNAGVVFASWKAAPNRAAGGQADDPLDDWKHFWPPAVVRAVCRAVISGPAAAYAQDALRLVEQFRPDLVVTNELLFGVVAACEARSQPVALLTANLWCFPTRSDVPPFGPGWQPAKTRVEQNRQASARTFIARWYDVGLPELNAARRGLGLPTLAHTLDQIAVAAPIVLSTSAVFDFGTRPPPIPFVYAGPQLEPGPAPIDPHPLIDVSRSNVLLSFSTTFQGQIRLLSRCMRALAGLDVNVIVTTGPAVRPEDLPRTANAKVVEFAPHDEIAPFCDLVVCHGGHGTLMRPLMLGVPVLCLPMGRDHADNGRRVAERGAGLTISRASPGYRIRRAARRILSQDTFRLSAQLLGESIRHESVAAGDLAADALEGAAQAPMATHAAA